MNIINISTNIDSEEITKKFAELEKLEAHLAERQAYLQKLEFDLKEFENIYYIKIFEKFCELDKIKEKICLIRQSKNELLNKVIPNIPNDEDIEDALDQDEYSKNIHESNLDLDSIKIKQVYRDLAKLIHPDLVLDDKERHYRQNLMIRVNQAYANNDINVLTAILGIWKEKNFSEINNYNSPKLYRICFKIAQIKLYIADIENKIKELESSETYQLKLEIESSYQSNENLFNNMILQLNLEIELANKELKNLSN